MDAAKIRFSTHFRIELMFQSRALCARDDDNHGHNLHSNSEHIVQLLSTDPATHRPLTATYEENYGVIIH